ncbi:MAG: COG1355, Predicted dioxygenase [uncultured Thermomicrobiales bacterium]|uniref:COG1355, Predicted dioxygenase n=1 Tax=uncultured Thermomicrobiales bacterium TaxID=1645740 RepID=A0A6J4VPU6_9BACT|nr:MAG: COG1355, Predicted dioxygenase [uncultured Thermomicrobiales bacterium]
MAVQVAHAARVERRRFTVEEYHRMAEAGILGEDDRVELIDGEIVQMSPIGGPHMRCVNRFNNLLVPQVGPGLSVSVQNPVRLSNRNEPQPDLAVLRDAAGADAVPLAAEALLVVEVADTSLRYDREVKLPRYAAAGIPEAWLADLPGERLERHSDPRDGAYTRVVVARRGETLVSTVLPGLEIPVGAVLGPRP